MAAEPQRTPLQLSVQLFRAFYESRPDEERWELIDGVPIMMTPPTLAHQVIASNLQSLLNDAFDARFPSMVALQRIGVDLAIEYYDPEPDVAVIDADAPMRRGLRYSDRFYLAAEIVSSSDRVDVEQKRAIYKLHDACKCILTVQQDRCEVRVDLRQASNWVEQVLTDPEQQLVLADFGLSCKLAELYRGTPLRPRVPRSPTS